MFILRLIWKEASFQRFTQSKMDDLSGETVASQVNRIYHFRIEIELFDALLSGRGFGWNERKSTGQAEWWGAECLSEGNALEQAARRDADRDRQTGTFNRIQTLNWKSLFWKKGNKRKINSQLSVIKHGKIKIVAQFKCFRIQNILLLICISSWNILDFYWLGTSWDSFFLNLF